MCRGTHGMLLVAAKVARREAIGRGWGTKEVPGPSSISVPKLAVRKGERRLSPGPGALVGTRHL